MAAACGLVAVAERKSEGGGVFKPQVAVELCHRGLALAAAGGVFQCNTGCWDVSRAVWRTVPWSAGARTITESWGDRQGASKQASKQAADGGEMSDEGRRAAQRLVRFGPNSAHSSAACTRCTLDS